MALTPATGRAATAPTYAPWQGHVGGLYIPDTPGLVLANGGHILTVVCVSGLNRKAEI